jgi:hypothetical protein
LNNKQTDNIGFVKSAGNKFNGKSIDRQKYFLKVQLEPDLLFGWLEIFAIDFCLICWFG